MEWLGLMEIDKHGKYLSTIGNVVTVLENDPSLRGRIGFNEFSGRVVKIGELPWPKLVNGENGDLWEDNDDAALRYYIEKVYGISCP
jgi:predicted P-loop ATPase